MHVLEVKDLIRNYQKSSFKKSEDEILPWMKESLSASWQNPDVERRLF